jgi:hypothetical protein
VEPVLGEGGFVVPPKEYFKVLQKICQDNGIVFIADEVQTGFGRTGKMFAMENYAIKPDMIAMAKGIANGFPLGACIARADIGDAFQPGDHLSTFGGNPLAMSAAHAVLKTILRDNILENCRTMAPIEIHRGFQGLINHLFHLFSVLAEGVISRELFPKVLPKVREAEKIIFSSLMETEKIMAQRGRTLKDYVTDFKIEDPSEVIKVEYLRPGAYFRYQMIQAKMGSPLGQYKPPKIIPPEKMDIYETLRSA